MQHTILRIEAHDSGFHDNQSIWNSVIPVPEGWAYLPENVATVNTMNFPYAAITTKQVTKDEAPDLDPGLFGQRGTIDVIDSWEILPIPEPTPYTPDPIRTDVMRNPGDVFTINGVTYKALMQIPAHGVVAIGTNAIVTTIENEINKGE